MCTLEVTPSSRCGSYQTRTVLWSLRRGPSCIVGSSQTVMQLMRRWLFCLTARSRRPSSSSGMASTSAQDSRHGNRLEWCS